MIFFLHLNPNFWNIPCTAFLQHLFLIWKPTLVLRNPHMLLINFFLKGFQQLSTFFIWVFHLVQSIHLSLSSIKEFVNRLCFSPTHFHGIHLQQRSFYTDGKFPAFAFRLLIMKNTDIFLKYHMNQSRNSKPEIITFSGQYSATHSLLPWPASCL